MAYYGGWAPYVPVAKRRAKAARRVKALRKQGRNIQPVEIEAVLSGAYAGDGSGFDSANAFSWQRLPDGRVLVAAVSWGDVVTNSGRSQWVFVFVLVVSALLAWLA